jgi:hypothetical protein
MSQCLHIILTRNVVVDDLLRLAAVMKQPLLPSYKIGINLANNTSERRDLQFWSLNTCVNEIDRTQHDAVVFTADPGVTQWLPTRLDFALHTATATPFSIDEIYPIMQLVCTVFDARPALVWNRRALKCGFPLPTPADTPEAVNDFYGYDVQAAIDAYTVAQVGAADKLNDRLFKCWRCSCMKPAFNFRPLGRDNGVDVFFWLLGNYVAGGVPACIACTNQLTVKPAAKLTKADRLAYVTREAAKRNASASSVYVANN